MGELVNYNSVVVNLEPTENAQTNVRTTTYEQAFLGEETSDAKGRGRARRKKRKLERVANKREVRTERRKLKGDRQEERIERRKTRKAGRQDIRGEQQDARMERRNKRREAQENRNADSESDNEDEEETTTQQGGGQDSGSSSDSGSDNSQDTSTSGGQYDDNDDEDGAYSDEDEDGAYSDEDEDDSYSDEDEDDTYGEADESFAGDSSNFASEVTGKPSVPSAIQTICYQIEMNNEMISQLLQHKQMMEAKGKDTSEINDSLGDKYDKVQSLEAKLENFSGANGKVDPQRTKAVKIAKAKARKQRIENLPIPPVMLYKLLKKGVPKDKIKQWWETKGRQQHASKMNFDGTTDEFGTETTDYMDYSEWGTPAYDYDVIQPEVINLDNSDLEPKMNFSGFDGGSSNTFWKSLLIGGVIAFAGVYVIRKYKLLK